MPATRGGGRKPRDEHHVRLGAALRSIREAAGKTTRQIQKPDGSYYRSGTISSVEGGHSSISVEIIRAYARLRSGRDYVDLMAMRDRMKGSKHTEQSLTDDLERRLLDPRADPRLLRRGYVMDQQEDTAHLSDIGAPRRNLYKMAVRPLSPNARYFVLRYGHVEDPRRGVASLEAGAGCDVVWVDEDENGIILAVLEFSREAPDQFGRHNFSFAINIRSDIPTKPLDAIHTNSLIVHIVKHVQFEPPAIPEQIWWFRGVDPFQHQLEPALEQLLQINSMNFYYHAFYDVEAEGCGLAWRWAGGGPHHRQ